MPEKTDKKSNIHLSSLIIQRLGGNVGHTLQTILIELLDNSIDSINEPNELTEVMSVLKNELKQKRLLEKIIY